MSITTVPPAPRLPEDLLTLPKTQTQLPHALVSTCLARAGAVLKAAGYASEGAEGEAWIADAIDAAEGYVAMAAMIVSHYEPRGSDVVPFPSAPASNRDQR